MSVALLGIRDVHAFSAATVRRSGIDFRRDEREEMVSEGVVELYQLASEFDGRGTFDGWCSQQLPRRLGDAWRRLGEHRRITEEGVRHWDIPPPMASIDDPERLAEGLAEVFEDGLGERVEAALCLIEPFERFAVRRMVELVSEGYGWQAISSDLGIERGRLHEMRERLRAALLQVHEA